MLTLNHAHPVETWHTCMGGGGGGCISTPFAKITGICTYYIHYSNCECTHHSLQSPGERKIMFFHLVQYLQNTLTVAFCSIGSIPSLLETWHPYTPPSVTITGSMIKVLLMMLLGSLISFTLGSVLLYNLCGT